MFLRLTSATIISTVQDGPQLVFQKEGFQPHNMRHVLTDIPPPLELQQEDQRCIVCIGSYQWCSSGLVLLMWIMPRFTFSIASWGVPCLVASAWTAFSLLSRRQVTANSLVALHEGWYLEKRVWWTALGWAAIVVIVIHVTIQRWFR